MLAPRLLLAPLLLPTLLVGCTRAGPQGPGPDDEPAGPTNLLQNPGFELGESWWFEDNGVATHAWATTGDQIYQSASSFTALEGEHAQKIWGRYADSVPNHSESGLDLGELSPGDTLSFSIRAMTHSDDRVSAGNVARAFLRFFDNAGAPLGERFSDALVDESSEADTWHELSVEAEVPAGAATGRLGIRYTLADWTSTGSVYLDEAALSSTGSGAVFGERLLVWNDEFSADEIDTSKWNHELLAAGTYNNELQHYTDDPANSRIEDGQLVITAIPESGGNTSYSSARLNTDGKAGWRYGRIEGSLQVPVGVGTWPALWMLPTDWAYGNWPRSGEIDIMEHVGCDPNILVGTVHTQAYNHMIGTQQGGSLFVPTATTSSHVYSIDWTPERIDFFIDGAHYFRFENDGRNNPDTWPFDQVFHLVVNLAVGGDWGGYCGVDRSAFPQQYRVDWIRVYQNPITEAKQN